MHSSHGAGGFRPSVDSVWVGHTPLCIFHLCHVCVCISVRLRFVRSVCLSFASHHDYRAALVDVFRKVQELQMGILADEAVL